MVDKEKRVTEKVESEETGKGQTIILPYPKEKAKKIVCEVCGHANPEYTALCEMCSNYL